MVDGTYIRYTHDDKKIIEKIDVSVQHSDHGVVISFHEETSRYTVASFWVDNVSRVPLWTIYNWASLIEARYDNMTSNEPTVLLSPDVHARIAPSLGDICLWIRVKNVEYLVITPEHSKRKDTGLKIKRRYTTFDECFEWPVDYYLINVTSTEITVTPKFKNPKKTVSVDVDTLFGLTYRLKYDAPLTLDHHVSTATNWREPEFITSIIRSVASTKDEPGTAYLRRKFMGGFYYLEGVSPDDQVDFKIAFGENLGTTALLECMSRLSLLTNSNDWETKGKRFDLLINSIQSDQTSDKHVISSCINLYNEITK